MLKTWGGGRGRGRGRGGVGGRGRGVEGSSKFDGVMGRGLESMHEESIRGGLKTVLKNTCEGAHM